MTPRKPVKWAKLDNAAKIFPSTSNREDTKVFRFSCELREAVDPPLLSRALAGTMGDFPFYRSVLRKGVFWYYFEESGLVPTVREEYKPPCAPLYDPNKKTLLFEVTYFRHRINLEVYHAISDGTGALQFLRALVARYLALRHPESIRSVPALDYDASRTEKSEDSFARYYSGASGQALPRAPRAYHLTGEKIPGHRIKIIEGLLSVREVLAKSRELGVTMTEYLAGTLMCAIFEEMPVRLRRYPVVLTVPVNLRKYFSSESARNFFSVIDVGYDFSGGEARFEDVMLAVRAAFGRELTPDRLAQRLNELSAIEHNLLVSVVPLGLKDIGLRVANYMTEVGITAAFSNIGRITMPQELCSYIRLFDVCCSTRRLQLCMCSFGDNLTMSFTSPFAGAEVEKNFFRALSAQGLHAEVFSNLPEDGGETQD